MLYVDRSTTYAKLKKFDEALKDCDKAIELAPRSADCYQAPATFAGWRRNTRKHAAITISRSNWRRRNSEAHNGLAWSTPLCI